METLPAEILIQIVKKVDWRTACSMQLVCKQWNRVISDPYVQKFIHYPIRFKRLMGLDKYPSNFLKDFLTNNYMLYKYVYESETCIYFFQNSVVDYIYTIRVDLYNNCIISNKYPASMMITFDFDDQHISRERGCWYNRDFIKRVKDVFDISDEWVPCIKSAEKDHYIELASVITAQSSGTSTTEYKCPKGCSSCTTDILRNCGEETITNKTGLWTWYDPYRYISIERYLASYTRINNNSLLGL